MCFIFGKKKTPAELLRESKRMLDKSIREIERKRQGLQAQDKKLIAEINKVERKRQGLQAQEKKLIAEINKVERKRQGLQAQDKKLIAEINKVAGLIPLCAKLPINKQGQMGAVKNKAKDLIRTRHQITKF